MHLPIQPHNHLGCFNEWTEYPGKVCDFYLPRTPDNTKGVVFVENADPINGVVSECNDVIP